MCLEPSDLRHLVLGPDNTTADGGVGVDGHVEFASDGRAIIENECDIGDTDWSREGLGRGEVTNIVITERCT